MDRPEVRLPAAGFPAARDGRWLVITIGIDPHKSSLTAVALTAGGEVAGTVRLPFAPPTLGVTCERGRDWHGGLQAMTTAATGDPRRPRGRAESAARSSAR